MLDAWCFALYCATPNDRGAIFLGSLASELADSLCVDYLAQETTPWLVWPLRLLLRSKRHWSNPCDIRLFEICRASSRLCNPQIAENWTIKSWTHHFGLLLMWCVQYFLYQNLRQKRSFFTMKKLKTPPQKSTFEEGCNKHLEYCWQRNLREER